MVEKPQYTREQEEIIQAIENYGPANIFDFVKDGPFSKKDFVKEFPPFSKLASFSLLRTDMFDARLVWTKDEDNEDAPYFIFVSPNEKKTWPSGKPVCPLCGCTESTSNGYAVTKIDDIPLRWKKTSLLVLYKRYECSKCGRTYSCSWKEFCPDRKQISARLRRKIGIASFSKMPFESVAHKMCVDKQTVRTFFDEEVKRRKNLKFLAAKHVGIDESKVRTAKEPTFYVCVLDTGHKDIAKNGIIALEKMPRTKENVMRLFESFDDLSGIETVSMDMCSAYRSAIEELNAIYGLNMRIIVDRFHIVKSLNDKFKDTLSNVYFRLKGDLEHELGIHEEMEDYTAPEPYEELEEESSDGFDDLPFYFGKDDDFVPAVSSFDGLERTEIENKLKILTENYRSRWFTMKPSTLSERSRVSFLRLLNTFPELKALYEAKEELRFDFFDADTADEARAISEKAKETIRAVIPKKKDRQALETYFTTLDDSEWTKHIYSYFDDPKGHRQSNAKLELVNSLIKEINAASRGMSWEALKNKVLYGNLAVEHRKSLKSLKTEPWESLIKSMKQGSLFSDTSAPALSPEEWTTLVRTREMTSFLEPYNLSALTDEEKINILKNNDNIWPALMEFAQNVIDKENSSEQGEDSPEEVILPLRLGDWYANEDRYKAMLASDAAFLRKTAK